MQNLTFSGRACDHMIYDGACECNERRDPSFDFYAELARINAEEHQEQQEQQEQQVEEHLDDARNLDNAEYQRLLDYLAEEATVEGEDEYVDEDEPYNTGHLSPTNVEYDYNHYSPPASPYYDDNY